MNHYKLSKDPSFWEGVDEEIWEQRLWSLNRQNDEIQRLKIPSSYHKGLIVLYATDLSARTILGRRNAISKVMRGWNKSIDAVWLLLNLSELLEGIALQVYLLSDKPRKNLKKFANEIITEEIQVNYNGLDESVADSCLNIIKLKAKIISAIGSSETSDTIQGLVGAESEWIKLGLESNGITSLLHARAVRSVLLAACSAENIEHGDPLPVGRNFEGMHEVVENDKHLKSIAVAAGAFYTGQSSNPERNPVKAILDLMPSSGPVKCRLSNSQELVPIANAKYTARFDEEHQDFAWLKKAPLNQFSLLSLLADKPKSETAEILSFIGNTSYDHSISVSFGRRRSSKSKDQFNTDFHKLAVQFGSEPGVPTGYLAAILASDSIGEADYELLKKGLMERYELHRQLPIDIFALAFGRRAQSDRTEATLSRIASELISEHSWPLIARRRGALYKAQRTSNDLPPLVELESELGL